MPKRKKMKSYLEPEGDVDVPRTTQWRCRYGQGDETDRPSSDDDGHGGPCTSSPTNARSATVGARVRSTDVSTSSSGSGQAGSSAILLKRHGGPCTSSPTNARSATVGARVRSTDVSTSSSGSGQAGSSAILLKRHGGPCTSSPTNARSATVDARVRSTDVSTSSSGSGQAGSSAILTRTSGGVARVFADNGSKLPPSYSDPTSTCMSSDLLENEEPGNRATNDTSCFLGEEIVTCVDASGIERNPDHESSHTRSDGDDTDSEQGGNFPENSDNSEQGGNFLDSSDNSKQGGNFPESSDDSEHGDNSEQGGNFPESSDDSEQGDNSEQGGNFPESSNDSEHSDNSEQGGNFPESSDDSEHGDADPDDDDPEGDIDGDEPIPGPDDDDPDDDDDPEGDIDGDEPMPGPEIDETLNVPLYEVSSVTKAEALLMVLSFVMRHCLSSIAVCHLFELLNVLVGKYLFQSTKSILRHIFCNDVIQLSFHFYCISCYSFVRSFQCVSEENISCPQCTNPCIASDLSQGNFFVTANLGSQVRNLFERADIAPHLSYRDARHKQHEDNIEDIYDGEIYKKMREDGQPLSNPNNFSFTFNSDGMPVFKSSKYSLWPIYIMINELPPKLRFNNLILAGVWFGKVEPKMEVFLEKFTIEANKLSEEGVFWKRGEEIINSKLYEPHFKILY